MEILLPILLTLSNGAKEPSPMFLIPYPYYLGVYQDELKKIDSCQVPKIKKTL